MIDGHEIAMSMRAAYLTMHRAAEAHLPPQRFPVKAHGCLHAAKDFTPFRALKIRVEDESSLVEPLEKNHPDIRQSITIDGRQRDTVRVIRLALGGVIQPFGEQPEGFGGAREVTRC